MENQKMKNIKKDINQESLPQIFMRHPDITKLPPFALPYGCSLHGHIENENENKKWEDLIEKSFERYLSNLTVKSKYKLQWHIQ